MPAHGFLVAVTLAGCFYVGGHFISRLGTRDAAHLTTGRTRPYTAPGSLPGGSVKRVIPAKWFHAARPLYTLLGRRLLCQVNGSVAERRTELWGACGPLRQTH